MNFSTPVNSLGLVVWEAVNPRVCKIRRKLGAELGSQAVKHEPREQAKSPRFWVHLRRVISMGRKAGGESLALQSLFWALPLSLWVALHVTSTLSLQPRAT